MALLIAMEDEKKFRTAAIFFSEAGSSFAARANRRVGRTVGVEIVLFGKLARDHQCVGNGLPLQDLHCTEHHSARHRSSKAPACETQLIGGRRALSYRDNNRVGRPDHSLDLRVATAVAHDLAEHRLSMPTDWRTWELLGAWAMAPPRRHARR